jgi:hypothetical protein
MAITDQITVEIAAVDVTDEYRVELKQLHKRVDYSPLEAEQLGIELLNAAERAREALADHIEDTQHRIKTTEFEPLPMLTTETTGSFRRAL